MVKSSRETILVIEDEDNIRNFAARVLELEGYHVLQAADGEKGLELARGNQVTLVLLDWRLPGQNGLEILSQMKSNLKLSTVPVVMFTASADVQQRSQALAGGAAGYLVKPLSVANLKESVACILGRKASR